MEPEGAQGPTGSDTGRADTPSYAVRKGEGPQTVEAREDVPARRRGPGPSLRRDPPDDRGRQETRNE